MENKPRKISLKEAISTALELENKKNIEDTYASILKIELDKVNVPAGDDYLLTQFELEQDKLVKYLNFYVELGNRYK